MEEKKTSKGLIWIIIILFVLIMGIIVFFIYNEILMKEKEKNDKNKTPITTATVNNNISMIKELLPNDLSNYHNQKIWDYQYLYDYYFTMEDYTNIKSNDYFINYYNKLKDKDDIDKEFESYDFVKIKDNKLYWKISNEWKIDSSINENIKYFYIGDFEGGIEYFVVLTDSNILYKINIESESNINYDYDKNEYILTKGTFDSFKYQKIDSLENVNEIKHTIFQVDCISETIIYFETDNNIFALYDNKLNEVEDFIPNFYNNAFGVDKTEMKYYINDFTNNCSPYGDIIDIDFDGTLVNVKDKNNSNIKIKYYINAVKNDSNNKMEESFDLIIDVNNNLYVIDRIKNQETNSIKTLEVFETIREISSEKNIFGGTIINKITLSSGDNIILKK